jgi:hypothetical protein
MELYCGQSRKYRIVVLVRIKPKSSRWELHDSTTNFAELFGSGIVVGISLLNITKTVADLCLGWYCRKRRGLADLFDLGNFARRERLS